MSLNSVRTVLAESQLLSAKMPSIVDTPILSPSPENGSATAMQICF